MRIIRKTIYCIDPANAKEREVWEKQFKDGRYKLDNGSTTEWYATYEVTGYVDLSNTEIGGIRMYGVKAKQLVNEKGEVTLVLDAFGNMRTFKLSREMSQEELQKLADNLRCRMWNEMENAILYGIGGKKNETN